MVLNIGGISLGSTTHQRYATWIASLQMDIVKHHRLGTFSDASCCLRPVAVPAAVDKESEEEMFWGQRHSMWHLLPKFDPDKLWQTEVDRILVCGMVFLRYFTTAVTQMLASQLKLWRWPKGLVCTRRKMSLLEWPWAASRMQHIQNRLEKFIQYTSIEDIYVYPIYIYICTFFGFGC